MERLGSFTKHGQRHSRRLRATAHQYTSLYKLDLSDSIQPTFTPNAKQLKKDIRKWDKEEKKRMKKEESKEEEEEEPLPPTWYCIDLIHIIRRPTKEEQNEIDYEYVADVHCHGDEANVLVCYDATKLAKAYEKDGLLLFWEKTNKDDYNNFIALHETTLIPSEVESLFLFCLFFCLFGL